MQHYKELQNSIFPFFKYSRQKTKAGKSILSKYERRKKLKCMNLK